ncbi:methyl-accepting chemotaxis protein [Peribacillus huizhouensis]|uniref:Methyl-accepting chemotaxis protein n=1 Tax=Peribacillus huizhouensis TaxID=1501239 RepID=A0ABR6CLQ5_9BACI|nr:methyl-accepting chemotaxis protein [Peribacillus huizhouensis]MBA9025952.1 methyl-accepting chemotaxis protein [Peribacillus huizhouensis]
MRNFFRNFKTRLFFFFAVILIIPALVVGSLAYLSASEAIEEEIMNSAAENINLLDSIIDSSINPKIHDVTSFSESVTSSLFQGEDSPKLREQFAQYLTLHPEVLSIYIGANDGLLIQEPRVVLDSDFDLRGRDWYKNAIERKGEIFITEPYVDVATKDHVVTIAKELKDGSGVVAIDIKITYLQKLTNEVKVGKDGYAFLLDRNKHYIAHPTKESGSEAKESFFDTMYKNEKGTFEYQFDGQVKQMAFTTNKVTGWKLGGTMLVSEVDESASPIFKSTLTVLIIAIIIGAVVVYFVVQSIIKPIKKLKESVITVSKGDLTEQIEIKSNDEIGQLGDAFNDMQESLRTLIQKVELSSEQLAASAEELTANAEQTGVATEQVAVSIQEVASSTEKQTSGVDRNAESLNELTQGIANIAESSSNVAELSLQTTMQAEEGGKAVQNTKEQMNSIHQSVTESNEMIQSLYERSQEISSILDVITEIADQTNLLSLNAAIESARAGEHGKGFAVVADEVKKLANQSQSSAKQISDLIQDIQMDTLDSVHKMALVTNDVRNGLTISDEAFEKFEVILNSMKEITPHMEEVSATAEQMSAGVQEVSSIANELAFLAKGNAATSEEVAASTEEQLASMEEISASARSLSQMAEELKELIAVFKY